MIHVVAQTRISGIPESAPEAMREVVGLDVSGPVQLDDRAVPAPVRGAADRAALRRPGRTRVRGEVVVERPVLLDHEDHVLDRCGARLGARARCVGCPRGRGRGSGGRRAAVRAARPITPAPGPGQPGDDQCDHEEEREIGAPSFEPTPEGPGSGRRQIGTGRLLHQPNASSNPRDGRAAAGTGLQPARRVASCADNRARTAA